jgi:hypothetical protein
LKRKISKYSRLPEVGAAFNQERFIELLHHRRDGATTGLENEYIEKQLQRSEEARQLLELVKETFPDENFSLPHKQSRVAVGWKVIYIIIAVLILAGSGYIIAKQHQLAKATQVPALEPPTYRFRQQTLSELGRVIELHYAVKIVFDKPEVASYHYTGYLKMTNSLFIFLEDIVDSSGIEYYFDRQGNLHFK